MTDRCKPIYPTLFQGEGLITLQNKQEDQWSYSSPESIHPRHSRISKYMYKANCTVWFNFECILRFNGFPIISNFDAELLKKINSLCEGSLCEGQCQIWAIKALHGK